MSVKKYARIVLLSGKQGSGKTTTQKALIDAWNQRANHKAVLVNFADPLYEMAEAVRNIAARYGIPKKMPKDGPLLQVLGTEWGRNTVSENIWVDALRGKMDHLYAQGGVFAYDHPLFVVGDCRFRNEFELFPEALRVRLKCPEATRRERCSMWRENSQHQSEIDLDGFDEEGRFDLYLDTWAQPPEEAVRAILEKLNTKWKDERRP